MQNQEREGSGGGATQAQPPTEGRRGEGHLQPLRNWASTAWLTVQHKDKPEVRMGSECDLDEWDSVD